MAISSVNVLLFEASTRCNLSCIYCYNAWHAVDDYPSDLLSTRRTIGMLAKVIAESGVKRIAFTGGEPLLRDDLPELVFAVRSKGVVATLLTNGLLLDREWVRDLLRAEVSQIQLTLLGMDPEVHDRHCGRGQHEKVMAALELLESMGAHVTVNMVVTRHNIEEIPAVMRLIAERGQSLFLLNRFNPGGHGLEDGRMEDLMLDREDTIRMLTLAQQGAEELGITPAASVPIPPCVVDHAAYPKVTFAGCAAASDRSYFALDPRGNVRACNHSPVILGNVLETPFLEIANSPALDDWNRIRPPFCEPCPGWDACQGGCRAAGQQMGLGFDELDPWVAHCLGDQATR